MKIIRGMLTFAILAAGPVTVIGGEINTLLEVDTTDPLAVTISATGALPGASSTGSLTYHGVFLENFFATYALFQGPASGDLAPIGSRGAYNHAESPGSENYLNIYRRGIEQQSFDTSLPAFKGTLTLDLSSQLIVEPGAVGDISVGTGSNGPSVVIGQWSIIDSSATIAASDSTRPVPEPGSAALLALGLAAIACRRQH